MMLFITLERVQRKAARFCLQNFNRTVSVTDMLRELECDTLEMRRKKNRLTLTYKLSHSLVVDIKTEKFLVPSSETWARRNHAFKYRIPKIRKDVFKFSFFLKSICEGSSLPSAIVNSQSIDYFKTNLANYLKYEMRHALGRCIY